MANLQEHIEAAKHMADLFASVGAEAFDLTFKKLDESLKPRYRNGQGAASFRNSLPHLVPSSFANQYSLIARPRSRENTLVQLDDLDTAKLEAVEEAAFLVIETSPANYQAWISIEGQQDEDFTRRLKRGTGADINASGATRWAGTANFKAKYAPVFPVVKIIQATQGRILSKSTIEGLGILSAPLPLPPPVLHSNGQPRRGRWPSYAECLKRAPEAYESGKPTGKPDVSRADFTFAVTAADWGQAPEDIAARLQRESSKAIDPQHGAKYAIQTATRAAEVVAARKLPRQNLTR